MRTLNKYMMINGYEMRANYVINVSIEHKKSLGLLNQRPKLRRS